MRIPAPQLPEEWSNLVNALIIDVRESPRAPSRCSIAAGESPPMSAARQRGIPAAARPTQAELIRAEPLPLPAMGLIGC
jgi:hypothetical protein